MFALTRNVVMVRPASFGYNPETAENNNFQTSPGDRSTEDITSRAVREFDQMVAALRKAGVRVHVIEDDPTVKRTDAVFPNNWITLHPNGAVVTYPMFSPIRRQERREEIIEELAESFVVDQRIRLENLEARNQFLEGTGSLILDRQYNVAYACRSPRTHPDAVRRFDELTGFRTYLFDAADTDGVPIYHTNVLMALADRYVIICMNAITQPREQRELQKRFAATRKVIIPITHEQMNNFAGNALQVLGHDNQPVLIMSSRAYDSLRPDQIERLESFNPIVHVPIPTIETYGGGSARCMIAENFLPERS